MATLYTIWWVWLAAAIVLGILEIAAPAFIFLGFAIGAAITSLIVLIAGSALSLTGTLLIFAILSLIAWLVLQKVFAMKKGQVKTFTDDINEG